VKIYYPITIKLENIVEMGSQLILESIKMSKRVTIKMFKYGYFLEKITYFYYPTTKRLKFRSQLSNPISKFPTMKSIL